MTFRNRPCTAITACGMMFVAAAVSNPAAASFTSSGHAAEDQRIPIVENWTIHFQEAQPEFTGPDGYNQRFAGQTATRTVQLPTHPANALDARRIVMKVTVTPRTTTRAGREIPNDPWNRLGNVMLLLGERPDGTREEIELIRFITGYGGEGVFEQDVTEFAPLLAGARTFRVYLSSFSDLPSWTVSCELLYTDAGRGAQAPVFASSVFVDMHMTAKRHTQRATVDIPKNVDQPRLRIITTGHATNGEGANEFVSSPHILRIDGREVARWRPWSEGDGTLRNRNPWSGRTTINGREIWASDLPRTGWNPGSAVEPLYIPVPELTPGPHVIELAILSIRPEDPLPPPDPNVPEDERPKMGGHGYWSVSASVVAEAPLNPPADSR